MLTAATVRRILGWNALIALCLLSARTEATPAITGVSDSGGLVNGATVTINGSGFGTKIPAAPYVWADFKQGNLDPSPLGLDQSWGNSPGTGSSVGNMVYSATGGPQNGPYAQGTPQSGSGVSWAFFVDPPATSTGAWAFTWNDLGAKYYVFRKAKKNFATANTINWKPFRMYSLFSGGTEWVWGSWNGNVEADGLHNTVGGMSSAYAATYVNGATSGTATSPTLTEGPLNQWFSDEIAYQVNTCYTCTDGTMQWWVNGSLVGQEPIYMGWTTYTLTLRDSATNEDIANMAIQGVADNDPSFPTTNTFGLADIYVDNTWSRVMIGNASTWAASTVHDVEIPTAWADGSINAVLHNDSLPNLDGAYLYVFDSNGNVNPDGYPLCGSCPQPPSNLTAS